jgi:hypothetical protein
MKRVAPPGGAPAPTVADGLDLRALGLRVTERYGQEFPDEDQRYEPEVWRAWCCHDAQHIMQWAALDGKGALSLDHEVDWLASVLAARGFPLDRLARTLGLCAEAVAEEGREDVAVRLRRVAGRVG